MKNRFVLFIERLFKIRACKKCGSWKVKTGYYISGYNHLCKQASGDRGVICRECLNVEFDESLEDRRSKAPEWVDVQI